MLESTIITQSLYGNAFHVSFNDQVYISLSRNDKIVEENVRVNKYKLSSFSLVNIS